MLAHVAMDRTYSNWTTTSPGALTELYDNTTTNQDNASVGAAWALKSTAGATGNGTVTLSGTNYNGAILIALKVAVTATTMATNTVAAANICAGSTKVPIQSFTLAQTLSDVNLTALSFATTGTYSATDITKFQLWTNTTNNLGTASQVGSDITTSLGTGSHTFSGLTQTLTAGNTRYFWITTDVAASPSNGVTLAVNALGTSDFTVSAGTKAGSASAGGTQTIYGNVAAAGSISGTTPVCQGQSGVGYSVPAIANATGYVWTLPSGASIASGNNTNSITVNFSTGASSGNITVYGTNPCGNGTVSPNYSVTVNTSPAVYNVTGGGTYCSMSVGAPVGLSGSESGTSYQLYVGGSTPVGSPVAGTGSALDFGKQPAGTYTVVASNANCCTTMNGNAVVTSSGSTSQSYTTPGIYTFTPMYGVSQITVECWGGGGGGYDSNGQGGKGGGGGGDA